MGLGFEVYWDFSCYFYWLGVGKTSGMGFWVSNSVTNFAGYSEVSIRVFPWTSGSLFS